MNKNIFFILVLFAGILSSCQQVNQTKQQEELHKLRVGVFNGNGASPVCILETLEALKIDSGISSYPISALEIMEGKLDQTDVLIFPGGSGSKELNNLGQKGADKVRAFARQVNKGIVGICAGGYMLTSTPDYPSLGIIPITHIRDHYNRGRGLISFSQNDVGDHYFPENSQQDSLYVQYYDGPIYNIPDTSSVVVLANINTDIAPHKDDPKGVTPGKAAFIKYNYGQGGIVASIGHPEATHGMRWMVPRMARIAAGAELISYSPSLIKPDAYQKELLFFDEDLKFEKEQFWQLSNKNPEKVIEALENLKHLHSRPAIRWSIGLLRHRDVNVRLKAAEYLVYTEYTNALPDLKQAWENESEDDAKTKLKKYYEELRRMIP